MISLIQRVSDAKIIIKNKKTASINRGLLLFLGVFEEDDIDDINYSIKKIVNMRIFSDSNNKMNYSIKDINGEILIVSQFTLCANIKKGRRPSFYNAAHPQKGKQIYNLLINEFKKEIKIVKSGIFGENMNIKSNNTGPVTIIINSKHE